MSSTFRQLGLYLAHVFRRFDEDRCLQLAASLTYTSLLALVPIIAVALTIVAKFPLFAQFTDQLNAFLEQNILPQMIREIVSDYLDEFSRKAANLTVFGVTFISVTALALMFTIDRAFNHIWRVRHRRSFARRFFMYLGMLVFGPVLIGASLTMTSFLVSTSLGWTSGIPLVSDAVLKLVPLGLTTAAFTMLYFFVPGRTVHPLHALTGGIVAGLLFELMKRGFALYIAHTPTYTMVYGTFATIPIFLLWVYLSWVVTVLGAIVTALLPDYKTLGTHRRQPSNADFLGTLDIFRVLINMRAADEPLSVRRICSGAGLQLERCEALLENMLTAGWVRKRPAERWTLDCDPALISVADVHRRFAVVPALTASESGANPTLQRLFAGVTEEIEVKMSVSIAMALFGPGDRESD